MESVVVPVMRGGKAVGYRRRFDNRLLYAACYREPTGRFDNTKRR